MAKYSEKFKLMGWHYQHNKWVKTLKRNKIFQGMSRKAADNASMESYFGLLKQEIGVPTFSIYRSDFYFRYLVQIPSPPKL